MFPFGYTLEDLKTGVSRVRNRVIARVFHELQFMEEWGSGYKRMIEECHSGGYREPKWEELGSCIRVTFFPYSDPFLAEERRPDSESTERELAILSLFRGGESLPFREIHARLSFPISERMLRYCLADMKGKRLLIFKGKGRGIVWQKV